MKKILIIFIGIFFTNCKSKYESNTLVKNFKKVESINLDARESNVNNNIFTNIAIEYDKKIDSLPRIISK